MSTVETPPPPTPVERRCPRCGARLSAEQEWCLNCGAAVGTRIAEPRGWRASLAIVGVLLALALSPSCSRSSSCSRDAESVHRGRRHADARPPRADRDARARRRGRRRRPTPTASPPDAVRVGDAEGGDDARPPTSPSGPRARPPGPSSSTPRGTREDAERLAGELAGQGRPGRRRARLGRLRVAAARTRSWSSAASTTTRRPAGRRPRCARRSRDARPAAARRRADRPGEVSSASPASRARAAARGQRVHRRRSSRGRRRLAPASTGISAAIERASAPRS